MKIEIMTIDEQNIRIHTLSGEFNFDYLFQYIVDVYNDPSFEPRLSSIWDLTRVKNVQTISLEQLEKIVAYVSWKRAKLGKIKTALVVTKKVDFGLARMYEQEMEATNQAEINVFQNIDRAIEWINS
jgi:hypothetical protein